MDAGDLCQYLDWDSNFFGYRIARTTVSRLDYGTVERLARWCDAHAIDCLYFLGDSDDALTTRLAEDYRLRFVDIRVTLEQQLDGIPAIGDGLAPGLIRLATPNDVSDLRAMARENHRDSRFYYDPRFPPTRCDALYETWIERSCNGYADTVLIAELSGCPAGYVTCHVSDQARGQIGLLGIGAAYQGTRLGQKLLRVALRWFAERGVTRVTVVTQGRNCRAQRLYQRCGFLTQSVQLWYHWWFGAREIEAVE